MSSFLIACLVTFYCAGFYRLLNSKYSGATNQPSQILIWSGCTGLALIWHSPVITQVLANGNSDSFFHLDSIQRLGLLVWSFLMIMFISWLSIVKTKWVGRLLNNQTSGLNVPTTPVCLIDILITILLFELVYSVSPQFYYLYYLIIFDYLPLQWINPNAIGLTLSLERLFMHPIEKFSDLLAGLVFWVLILQITWHYLLLSGQNKGKGWASIFGVIFGLTCFIFSLNSW